MLIIENTDNIAGVSIKGDYQDLNRLTEALHEIIVADGDEKYAGYINISIRILEICYAIRHAIQGEHEIKLVDNCMDEKKMKFHSLITSRKNVYYSCNFLYPEMFFALLALNKLVELRVKDLSESEYVPTEAFNEHVIWDDTIAVIRVFQAKFVICLKELLTAAAYSRWLKIMNDKNINIEEITEQYVDFCNITYINMDKQKRLKSLFKTAKRLAEFRYDAEYQAIKAVVVKTAREQGCPEEDIRLKQIEYPEKIVW